MLAFRALYALSRIVDHIMSLCRIV